MSASVHQFPTPSGRRQLVTKAQLSAHLGRSSRWIELRMNDGLPSEENLDRRGRRMFDLEAVEGWLADGKPVATTTVERLARLEAEVQSLQAKVKQLERGAA